MKKNYKCEECGKEITTDEGSAPDCCGKPMKEFPLEPCLQPAHAEHSRPMEKEDACDDFRGG